MKQPTQVLKTAVVFLLAQLLCWQTCFGQVDPWERVKLIEQGKKVAVKLQSGKTLNGKMEAWSPEGMTVRQGEDKVAPFAKSDIAQVSLVAGMSRGRMAKDAFLITGGITGGVTGAVCASSGCSAKGVIISGALAAVVLGGVAACISSLFPPHKEVIYTSAASAPGDSVR